MIEAGATEKPRRLSFILVLGILISPAIFAWFTLRRGYSRDVRIGAFLLVAFTVAAGFAREFTR